ncbi:MAG: glycosyltransferase family 4 protein [Gammaproteobacteria bacterium]|jgi:glycosyltransferase involved in cell wall biosynthesis
MKVLHVEAGRHLYGGGLQVAWLLEGLGRHGVESVLVCPRGSAIAAKLQGWTGRVHEISMRGDLDLGLLWRLGRLIRAERPDIVHLHSRRGADLLGGVVTRLAGVKTVLSRRVDNPESPFVARWKYRLYDRVITISEGIRQVLLAEGVDPERLVCVRSAVDTGADCHHCEQDWFRRSLGLAGDETVLAVIAQLIPRKGHRYLLQVLPGLIAEFPELRVFFFGQGPLEDKLRRQIRETGLGAKVTLAGFRTDLPRFLPCLDLVVHPAVMEGLGISLLQAAAAGVPIVAANAGGMPEVVRDGGNGLLVPPGDSPALAAAIRRLLSDRALMRRMGEVGRALVASEFSIDRMVEGNLQVYRELCRDG